MNCIGYAVSMFKFILSFICLFTVASLAAETVYKKTNPDGTVEFTDTPSIDSEKIKIREPSTYTPIKLPFLTVPLKKQNSSYSHSIIINQPVNDVMLVNPSEVQVSISLLPFLLSGKGHKIRYSLAGDSIVSKNLSVTFKNVPRGTHVLSVSIVDASGEVVGSSASRTFHVKRFFKKRAGAR